jgi:hypothetical protein
MKGFWTQTYSSIIAAIEVDATVFLITLCRFLTARVGPGLLLLLLLLQAADDDFEQVIARADALEAQLWFNTTAVGGIKWVP